MATGPAFLLCNTYRYRGHHVGDIDREYYRSKQEEQHWMAERDPINGSWRNGLSPKDWPTPAALETIRQDVTKEMDAAVEFAIERTVSRLRPRLTRTSMPEIATASRPGLRTRGAAASRDHASREADPRGAGRGDAPRSDVSCMLGEDVAEAGTAFKVLSGLVEEFGTDRVIDTPISEAGFTGLGVGAAMTGMRPVVDIMFGDFLTLVMDQIVNQAAKIHYMSGGKLEGPAWSLRTTMGATRRSAAQHSQIAARLARATFPG